MGLAVTTSPSIRSSKIKRVLLTISALGIVAGVLLAPTIRAAREEARSRPFVSLFGHGSANHMTYRLSVSGKATLELEQESEIALRRLAECLSTDVETGNEVGMRIHTCLYLHAPSSLRDQLASLAEMIPGLDHIVIDRVR